MGILLTNDSELIILASNGKCYGNIQIGWSQKKTNKLHTKIQAETKSTKNIPGIDTEKIYTFWTCM